MGYIFMSRSLGMLIGPVLGGDLAKYSFSFPGIVTALLIFSSGLCTLMRTNLVEPEHGEGVSDCIGMCELLKVRSIPLMLSLVVIGMIAFTFLGPMLEPYLEAQPYKLDSGMVGVAFSFMTFAYAVCNALIARIARRVGEEVSVSVSTVLLGVLFLFLGPSPLLPFVPQNTGFFFLMLVLLGFAVGGIMVPGQALMAKAAAAQDDGTVLPTERFSESLSALSNYAFTSGAVLGPLFAIVVKNRFQVGCTCVGLLAIFLGVFVGMAFRCCTSQRPGARLLSATTESEKDGTSLPTAA
jgi:MFS family permease